MRVDKSREVSSRCEKLNERVSKWKRGSEGQRMRERCEGNGPVEIDREKDGDDQRRGVEGRRQLRGMRRRRVNDVIT